MPMDQYRRGNLVFDVIDAGPADGPVVVLLHGFPQLNTSWNAVIARLTARGYRCLAPNQRGYSEGARPTGRWNYRASELTADVGALIEASGASRVHVVGHDFGARVAWDVAARMPERLATVVPLSVPHPAAGLTAVFTTRQGRISWYIYFFQLPWLPELVFLGGGETRNLTRWLQAGGQTRERAERDTRAMAAPGAFTAALNWYRGTMLVPLRGTADEITIPTMHVWSDCDAYLVSKGAHATGRYVSAEYRFETLRGVSHWMLDECPDVVADVLLDWFSTHPVGPAPR